MIATVAFLPCYFNACTHLNSYYPMYFCLDVPDGDLFNFACLSEISDCLNSIPNKKRIFMQTIIVHSFKREKESLVLLSYCQFADNFVSLNSFQY